MPIKFRKVNRVFSPIKKYSWLMVLLIAVGGLFYPKLGLLLIPIMLLLIGLSLFNGKYWCGNLCPHASLFDYVILPIAPLKRIPKVFRSLPWRAIFFIFFMTMFSLRLFNVLGLRGTYDFWDKLGSIFSMNYLMPTIIGLLLGFTINPRTWCTFCPMGTMQSIAYQLGKKLGINKKLEKKITMSEPAKCRECGLCASVCPMQLVPYQEIIQHGVFSNAACIKCSVCVDNCPLRLLSLESVERIA